MCASGQPSYARKRRADGAAGRQLELHPRVFGGQCCADAMVGLDVWVRIFVLVSARVCLLPSLFSSPPICVLGFMAIRGR